MISQRPPATRDVDVESLLEAERQIVVSRNVIATIVNNFDLYPGGRQRHPMEEIVEEFRKSARIERSGPNIIRVAFTYGDSSSVETDLLAQRVVRDLASRVIAANLTQRSNMVEETVLFFRDQVERVGESWLKLGASLKATPVSDPRYELLELARDQKRKEYESVGAKTWNRRNVAGLGISRTRYQGRVARCSNAATTA